MSLWDHVYPENVPPDCPYVEYFKVRNDFLVTCVCFAACVLYFSVLLTVLKGRELWPVRRGTATSAFQPGGNSSHAAPGSAEDLDTVGRVRIDNRRLKRLLTNVVNKSKRCRSSRRNAKNSRRVRQNEQERCLLTERVNRQVQYDKIVAQKDSLKHTLMKSEQRCLGLMMEAQLRYVDWLDVQDEIKQVDIRTKLLKERLAFMRNK
ncbi:hypothetical protein LSAT2_011900 [Lamellibrachia satsuma]|nr:hypothetical protein LSAT2_011900 [Lamellibrachia satsuma]